MNAGLTWKFGPQQEHCDLVEMPQGSITRPSRAWDMPARPQKTLSHTSKGMGVVTQALKSQEASTHGSDLQSDLEESPGMGGLSQELLITDLADNGGRTSILQQGKLGDTATEGTFSA